jgi:alkylation response protein AidB-like acyl-CoA dehydrogenase
MFAGLVQLAKTTPRNAGMAIEDSEIRQRLATLEGTVRSHEYSGLRQLTRNARGEDPGIIQNMNKIVSTNIGSEVAKLAMDILGDDGLLDAVGGERGMGQIPKASRNWITQYMYSLGIAVAGGTGNIQRNVIGERGLGLPRDYYAERSSGK